MVKLEDFKVGEIKKMVSKYNKQVKIGPISKLNKADLIKHIREHPKLTVQESEKGVRISVKGEVNIGDKKIKIKKDKKPEPEPEPEPKKDNKRKRISKPINYDKPAKDVNIMESKTDKPKSKAIEISKQLKKVKQEKEKKPKIPSITVTEEEKPKKKVIKVGGKYITVKPKEVKADKMDMPKSKAKIRVAPKKEEKKDKQSSKSKDEEELEDLSKFKKSEKVAERTIEQIKKNIKYQKKQGNEAVVKSLEKELKEKEAEEKKEESSEEDEPDEISYEDFKLIKEVPKNIKKIWYDYVADRFGNQKEELEELKRIEKNYIEAESNRKNKSLSAKKQLKAVQTIGNILIETRKEINENADFKKIYKLFTPVIFKRLLDQKKKDEEDLKKEEEDIKKQQKADEKEQAKADKKK